MINQKKLKIRNKIFTPFKDVLILDIETKKKKINGRIEAENSETVIWGAYSYNTGKLTYGKRNNSPQALIDQHKFIVTHNGKDFDYPILQNDYGCNFYGKVHVDLLEVLRNPPSRAEKEAMAKKGKKPIYGKGRAKIIGEAQLNGMKDNRFPNLKLGTIIEHGHHIWKDHPKYSRFFTQYKDDLDYNILQKDNLTENDWFTIKKYLRQDIIITKNLFEFLQEYFEVMADKLSDEDIKNLEYMLAPTGKYFYKSICYALNLPEEYGEAKGKFLGAYVFLPSKERYTPKDGDGYCIDFNSQHPHHQWSANLFTPVSKCKHKVNGKCPKPYNGDGEIFKLNGTYCSCEMGEIEKWIRELYFGRVKFKCKFINKDGTELKFTDVTEASVGKEICYIDDNRNLQYKTITKEDVAEAIELAKAGIDPREYTYKILINSGYGVSSSAIFKSIYYEHCGPDTTLMSKQSIQFMSKHMEEDGYIITYGDTDSLYIMDPYKDKDRMLKRIAIGIKKIKDALPFSDPTYNMGIDAEFSHIFFFKEYDDDITKVPIIRIAKSKKDKEANYTDEEWNVIKEERKKDKLKEIKNRKNKFKKKNYIYIKKDGSIKINGLPLLKRNAPQLAKLIYIRYLEPEIKRTKNIKFERANIAQWIYFEIEQNREIVASKITVSPANNYSSPSQMQAQISNTYFNGKDGIFKCIKHTRKNYGVGKGKFYCSLEEAKDLKLEEYDLETVWNVLDPFIKKDKQLGLVDFISKK